MKKKTGHIIKAILLGAAIILFWRGIWDLADLYLFPSRPTTSALVSIVIGLSILYFHGFHLKELY